MVWPWKLCLTLIEQPSTWSIYICMYMSFPYIYLLCIQCYVTIISVHKCVSISWWCFTVRYIMFCSPSPLKATWCSYIICCCRTFAFCTCSGARRGRSSSSRLRNCKCLCISLLHPIFPPTVLCKLPYNIA